MGMESDQEITQLIGTDALYLSSISCSLQEASLNNIYTKTQALQYLSVRIKSLENINSNYKYSTVICALSYYSSL